MTRPDKETLIELLLVQRLTETQVAERFDVTRGTVSGWKKRYGIQSRDWWKYQTVKCLECDKVIDPDIQLDAEERKRIIRSRKPICMECREDRYRNSNRLKQAKWREKNREKYNEYMREWRKENKERWLEIKRESAKRNKQG